MRTWVMSRWRGLAVMATAVLVSGALVAGGVLAQTPPTAPPGRATVESTFIGKLAARLGIGQDQLTAAMKDTSKEMIDEAVQAGRIPQQAADRAKQRIDQGGSVFPPGRGFGRGPAGKAAPAGKQGLALGHLGTGVRELADWLGMTPQELATQLRSGQSLLEVAASKNKSRDQLVTFLTDTVKKHLDQAVANRKLTQERADQMLQRFRDNVDKLIERKITPRARANGSA